MKIHHVGLAVKSLSEGCAYLENLGAKVISSPCQDDQQKAKVQFVNLGGLVLELIEPISPDSPVMNSVKTNRRLYHLCYEVENFDELVSAWQKKECVMVSSPKPAEAFQGKRVAFFLTRQGDLFEFLEA